MNSKLIFILKSLFIKYLGEPKMRTYVFKVVVEPDGDRWHAYCPVLEDKGGATWGYTKEEALKNISEVVEMIIEELIEDGEPIPEAPEEEVQVHLRSPQHVYQVLFTNLVPFTHTI